MSLLSVRSFFQYFIYEPNSPFLTEREREIATFAFRILSAITLTALPYACKTYWKDRHVWTIEEEKLIKERIKAHIQSELKTGTQPRVKIFNHVLSKLYVGDSEAFVDVTHLTFLDYTLSLDPVAKTTFNEYGFESVISMCPLASIYDDYPNLRKLGVNAIQASFITHNVKWMSVGRATVDHPTGWYHIVHDCTFPDSEDAKFDLDDDTKDVDHESLTKRKKEAVLKTLKSEWFQPVFREIDRAVLYNKRVLVHCQAGISRSPTVVAAYLINRFGLTRLEALKFLTLKRACTSSKFVASLDEYQTAMTT